MLISRMAACLILKFLLLFLQHPCFLAIHSGDRISTLIQSLHQQWKSAFLEIPVNLMPKFRVPDSAIIQVILPRKDTEGPEMRLNPMDDVKMQLTFAHNKLVVPWVVLYDSKRKLSLQKLELTFYHDEFDILWATPRLAYGPPIARLDPEHPALRSVELVYKWQAVQEQDLSTGLYILFLVSFGLFIALACVVSCTYDRELPLDNYDKPLG